MASFEERGAAWRAEMGVRRAHLARAFKTIDEALRWARVRESKLLAGAQVTGGKASAR